MIGPVMETQAVRLRRVCVHTSTPFPTHIPLSFMLILRLYHTDISHPPHTHQPQHTPLTIHIYPQNFTLPTPSPPATHTHTHTHTLHVHTHTQHVPYSRHTPHTCTSPPIYTQTHPTPYTPHITHPPCTIHVTHYTHMNHTHTHLIHTHTHPTVTPTFPTHPQTELITKKSTSRINCL